MAQTNVTDLLAPIAEICRECPIPTMIRNYVDAAREFCRRSTWLRETVTGATIASQTMYSIGGDVYSEVVGIVAVSLTAATAEERPLTEKESGEWDPTADADTPSYYQYVPMGQMALYPTPDAIYPLTVAVVIQPVVNASSVDSRLVPTMDEWIRKGALMRLHKIKGTPWYDALEAENLRRQFEVHIASASHQADRGYNPAARTTEQPGNPSGMFRTQILTL